MLSLPQSPLIMTESTEPSEDKQLAQDHPAHPGITQGARDELGLCQITYPLPCALSSRGRSGERKSQDASCTDSVGKFWAILST